jgi:hypothetical protein
MNVPPILPIAGVPDELIRALNDRFRNLPAATVQEISAPAAPAAPEKPKVAFETATSTVWRGTHAARASWPAKDNDVYVETDRGYAIYLYIGATATWQYVSGVYQRTQAQLAALAATLTAGDTGFLVEVTDFAHVLRWSGAAWQWGPGEQGSGMLASFAVSPGTGWAACDGSTVSYLKSDGTTATVTLPNTAGSPAFLKSGSAYGAAITAKVLPTFAGTASQVTSGPTGTTTVQSGSGATVASSAHTHTLTPAGMIALPGDPVANFTAPLYFRK